MALFARPMRGPCAILAETWTGEQTLPLNLGKSIVDYLLDLRSNLENSLQLAGEHAEMAQKKYADYYNRRARDKSFEVGDHVLILSPDSTKSKTFARWQGPGKVLEVQSPHGYLVEINGTCQKVHADRMRHYLMEVDEVVTKDIEFGRDLQIDTCAIVHEEHQDFGEIQTLDTSVFKEPEVLTSQKMEPEKLAHLSEPQRKELLELLDRYAMCFSEKPGLTDKAVHNIRVTSDFKPRRLPHYRIPERLKAAVDKQVQEMVDLGIVCPSHSPMVSPLVCVLKGPGGRDGIRLAVDYRYLNRYTIPDEYPIPDIHSLLHEVGKDSYLTVCDCKAGYWQTSVNASDRWMTAFIYDGGLYEFTRTPFGLRNAGATFCRAVQTILKPIKEFTKSYVDDLIVHSNAWKRHLQELEAFLQTIEANHITLNLRKCEFAKPKVKYCGCLVGSGTREADPEKVSAVLALGRPENKTDLRRILGNFSYFREYIKDFAELALPLTDLTQKGVPNKIPWGPLEQQALERLKEALAKAAEESLHIVDWNKLFTIHCDASGHTVSGVLSQPDENGGDYPIAFYSVKLNKTQRNWAIVEKEAFAALEAVKRFKTLIYASPEDIILYSDHNPLLYLTQCAPKSAKLMRWSLALQEFPIRWRYKKGSKNVVADCLSRMT